MLHDKLHDVRPYETMLSNNCATSRDVSLGSFHLCKELLHLPSGHDEVGA